jgi:hypothetical protein
MNATVADAIAKSLAAIEREVPTPSAPFGYGTDVSCTDDLSPTLELVDPRSTRAIAEALLRRLDCPRGALPDDADYGLDLRSYCNRGHTADELRTLADRIRGECEKDDRVERAVVTVTAGVASDTLRVQIAVTPVDVELGGFSLVLAASSAAVLLEEMGAAA